MRLFCVLILLTIFLSPCAKAQETLPGFSASMKTNGKVLISWKNAYPEINQISIQRSKDSLRNFTTLITVPDPTIPENGFVDSKAGGVKMYYRIFILFPNSKYMFTKSVKAYTEPVETAVTNPKPNTPEKSKPVKPDSRPAVPPQQPAQHPVAVTDQKAKPVEPLAPEDDYVVLPKIDNVRIYYMMETPNIKKPSINDPVKIKTPTIEIDKYVFVKRRDSVIMRIAGNRVPRFSDSMIKQTKDTLFFVNADTLQIKPYVEVYREPKEVYKVSLFVFTSKDGNVTISLPDYSRKKYLVTFDDMDSTQVMDVKDIHDAPLIIDKTNFGHSGWFRFELFEDGKLKEKNKLLIPKD